MSKKYGYTVWIGSHQYSTRAGNSAEAKRNAAHQHRKRGYDRSKTISQIMKMAEARR